VLMKSEPGLIRTGTVDIKCDMETLLKGKEVLIGTD